MTGKSLLQRQHKRESGMESRSIIDAPTPYVVKNEKALAFIIQYHGETKKGVPEDSYLQSHLKLLIHRTDMD